MLKRIVITASYAQLLFNHWVPTGCTAPVMAGEVCESRGFLFGEVRRVAGVRAHFSDLLRGGNLFSMVVVGA
jgi:hypothetical protein